MTDPPDQTGDEDDAQLFRNAIGPVRKLPERALPPAAPKPRPRARMAERDEAAARDEFRHAPGADLLAAGDVLAWRGDVLPPQAWQRLRRGEIAIQDELDVHGADTRAAQRLLREFIIDARQRGIGCVRVIHGKGLHGRGSQGSAPHGSASRTDPRPDRGLADSSGAPLLKNLVDHLLRRRADVLAFHSAPPAQGGTGAVLVLLAPRRRR